MGLASVGLPQLATVSVRIVGGSGTDSASPLVGVSGRNVNPGDDARVA